MIPEEIIHIWFKEWDRKKPKATSTQYTRSDFQTLAIWTYNPRTEITTPCVGAQCI